jgi:hypothetical protein
MTLDEIDQALHDQRTLPKEVERKSILAFPGYSLTCSTHLVGEPPTGDRGLALSRPEPTS